MGLCAAEIERLMDRVFPQARAVGWQLEHVSEGRARVLLPLTTQHLRPGPSVSGPTLMTLADTAMYFAVLATLGEEPLAVTTSLHIDFLRRMGEGVVAADAEILKLGRSLVVGRVIMSPADGGPPIAHASVTYSVPPR